MLNDLSARTWRNSLVGGKRLSRWTGPECRPGRMQLRIPLEKGRMNHSNVGAHMNQHTLWIYLLLKSWARLATVKNLRLGLVQKQGIDNSFGSPNTKFVNFNLFNQMVRFVASMKSHRRVSSSELCVSNYSSNPLLLSFVRWMRMLNILPGNTSRNSWFGTWIHPLRCCMMHWNISIEPTSNHLTRRR